MNEIEENLGINKVSTAGMTLRRQGSSQHQDGLQKQAIGLLTPVWRMTKFWSVTRETRKEPFIGGFWVKVVGSNPAGPTKFFLR